MIRMGPAEKNLAILKVCVRQLIEKEIRGMDSALDISMLNVVFPYAFRGKNDDVAIARANDMWVYNK